MKRKVCVLWLLDSNVHGLAQCESTNTSQLLREIIQANYIPCTNVQKKKNESKTMKTKFIAIRNMDRGRER